MPYRLALESKPSDLEALESKPSDLEALESKPSDLEAFDSKVHNPNLCWTEFATPSETFARWISKL